LTVRHKTDLSTEACREWSVLNSFHNKFTKASSVPNLPHTEQVHGDAKTKEFLKVGESAERTYDGTPQALLPLLKRMSFRFPRPLITWDIFSEEAPSSFPSTGRADQRAETSGEGQFESDELRDPRQVNNVVHKGQTQGQWKRGQKEVEAEQEAETNSGVLDPEDLEEGKLYIVKLEAPEGEFSLGLVQLGAAVDEDMRTVYWFVRAGRSHSWPTRVKFHRYKDGETWISDNIPTSSFLLEVDFEDDLTDSSPPVRDTSPTLNSTCVLQIRMFAVAHHHVHEAAPKAHKKATASTKPNAKPAGNPPRTSANKRGRGEASAAAAGASTAAAGASTAAAGEKLADYEEQRLANIASNKRKIVELGALAVALAAWRWLWRWPCRWPCHWLWRWRRCLSSSGADCGAWVEK